MDAKATARFTVKGIVHCHTALSFDSLTPLELLCQTLRDEGFSFVALTDHARGVTPEAFQAFCAECTRLSQDGFVAIPGLEFCCEEGLEIAGIGISMPVPPGTVQQTVQRIREMGGYAIWVHPWKRGGGRPLAFECDAVEVLNAKVDGPVAPNLDLARDVRRGRKAGARFHAIFGLDMHDPRQAREVWTECEVSEVSVAGIVEALREGRFVSRVACGRCFSTGKIPLGDTLRFRVLQASGALWNATLASAPPGLRSRLVSWSRPLVRAIKGLR